MAIRKNANGFAQINKVTINNDKINSPKLWRISMVRVEKFGTKT